MTTSTMVGNSEAVSGGSSNEMEEFKTESSIDVSKKRSFCPCCTFTSFDLFLPDSEKVNKAASLAPSLPDGPSPVESWNAIADIYQFERQASLNANEKRPLLPIVVDTHCHAHLERDEEEDASSSILYQTNPTLQDESLVLSLTCAVEPVDWDDCVRYASQSPYRRAALGVHPWYLEDLPDDWLSRLEQLLQAHPTAIVGEIGLCKMARWVRKYPEGKQAALQLQRAVFRQQLQLAAQYSRAVSVHCVNQQSILLELLQESDQGNFLPPSIGLHSFSGTAHQIQQLLKWEATLERPSPLLYFGFSHTINVAMNTSEKAQRQTRMAVQAVPPDRLLAESDVHRDMDVAAGTAGAISFLAQYLDEPLYDVAERTRRNGIRFLGQQQNEMVPP